MIPDYCEAITAYRVWDVHKNGLLSGQAHGEFWPPYEPLRAVCGAPSEAGVRAHLKDGRLLAAPVKACDCGIYAYRLEADAVARVTEEKTSMYILSWGYRPASRAWGVVKLWGRIIEHEDGYRAEYAYPASLTCESEKQAAQLSALYGVPCSVAKLADPFDRIIAEFAKLQDAFGRPMGFSVPIIYGAISDAPSPTGIISVSTGGAGWQPPSPDTQQAIDKHLGRSRWQQRQQTKPASRPGFREKPSR